jgi:hypothetical protein
VRDEERGDKYSAGSGTPQSVQGQQHESDPSALVGQPHEDRGGQVPAENPSEFSVEGCGCALARCRPCQHGASNASITT